MTEQTTKRRFGKTASATTFKARKQQEQQKQDNRGVKDYKEYVYAGQEVDVTTLVPLTQDDYDYNAKVKDKVELDKEYKYSELCELLEETYHKGGNGKQVQLATWFQHFNWEHPINSKTKKPSKKFKITEIFDTPRCKINQTFELAHFKEQQLECNFVFSILNNDNLHEVVGDFGLITGIKARDMYKNIGLVNDDYYLVRSNKEAISDFLPVENQIEVFSNIENSNKKFTTGALNRLTRSRVIESYSYTYIWTDNNKKEHLATDQEHLAIENGIKKMVEYAQECGHNINSIADLYNSKLADYVAGDLHDYMIKLIREEVPNIMYFSRGFKVVYLKDKMRDYVNKVAINMNNSLLELQSLKLLESKKEHTDIQVSKAMNRNQNEPLTQDREVRLINVVVNNLITNPMTEQEIQQKEDRKFIIDRATVSDYIKSLAIEDINKILDDTVENYEQEQLDKLLDEAISYCYMPVTLQSDKKKIEFIDLDEYINKYDKLDSLYIRCNIATNKSMYTTLHINYTEKDKKKSAKLELILDSMYDIRKLQAYLVVTYNVNVKVGQKKPSKS